MTYVSEGFIQFKYALQRSSRLTQHEQSEQHKESVTALVWFVRQHISIDVILDRASLKSRHDGRKAMKIILGLAKTMARQGLAFRWHELEDDYLY